MTTEAILHNPLDDATAARIRNADNDALRAEMRENQRAVLDYQAACTAEDGHTDYSLAQNHDRYKDRTESDLREEMHKRRDVIYAARAQIMANNERTDLATAANMDIPEEHVFAATGQAGAPAVDPSNAFDMLLQGAPEGMNAEAIAAAAATGKTVMFDNPNVQIGSALNTITPITTSTGVSVAAPLRQPGVVMLRDKKIGITPRLRPVDCPAASDHIIFVKESSETDQTAYVTEGNTPPNSQVVGGDPQTIYVRKIVVKTAVTEEQTADVPSFRSFLNARLGRLMAQKLERQLISGTGSSGSEQGMVGLKNLTDKQSVARRVHNSGLNLFDQLAEGFDKLWSTGNTDPNAICMNYSVYKRLLQAKDTQGRPLWADYVTGGRDDILGIDIVIAQNLPDNEALVINTMDFAMLRKGGMKVELGTNNDDFEKGLRSIRVSFRANLIPYRGNSVVEVDMQDEPAS